jgi:hypothetical protein
MAKRTKKDEEEYNRAFGSWDYTKNPTNYLIGRDAEEVLGYRNAVGDSTLRAAKERLAKSPHLSNYYKEVHKFCGKTHIACRYLHIKEPKVFKVTVTVEEAY